jgi:hypothetical protein
MLPEIEYTIQALLAEPVLASLASANPQCWMRDPENRLVKLTPQRKMVW